MLTSSTAKAARRFSALPATCDRQVIDATDGGMNNDGVAPPPVQYYREKMIHATDAFMLTASNGFEGYSDLIKGKLLKEFHLLVRNGDAR